MTTHTITIEYMRRSVPGTLDWRTHSIEISAASREELEAAAHAEIARLAAENKAANRQPETCCHVNINVFGKETWIVS